jgi:hypothetical protein
MQTIVCIVIALELVEILVKKFLSKFSELSLDEEGRVFRGRYEINTFRHWVTVRGKVSSLLIKIVRKIMPSSYTDSN